MSAKCLIGWCEKCGHCACAHYGKTEPLGWCQKPGCDCTGFAPDAHAKGNPVVAAAAIQRAQGRG